MKISLDVLVDEPHAFMTHRKIFSQKIFSIKIFPRTSNSLLFQVFIMKVLSFINDKYRKQESLASLITAHHLEHHE